MAANKTVEVKNVGGRKPIDLRIKGQSNKLDFNELGQVNDAVTDFMENPPLPAHGEDPLGRQKR